MLKNKYIRILKEDVVNLSKGWFNFFKSEFVGIILEERCI